MSAQCMCGDPSCPRCFPGCSSADAVPPKSRDGDDPAFPLPLSYDAAGLTKREWFAGMAVQGLLVGGYRIPDYGAAADARKVADLLIAELEKPQEGGGA